MILVVSRHRYSGEDHRNIITVGNSFTVHTYLEVTKIKSFDDNLIWCQVSNLEYMLRGGT